jgi:poly-gamma-glutamate synthesis protein (capsule biosynthesis protein)
MAAGGTEARSGLRPVEADERMLSMFLCGDVMTGRGVDQILPSPGDPELHEDFVRSAVDYVRLAERMNGTIPAPVRFDYVWGDALRELDKAAPHARIVNLETSVTTSDEWEPKGINYRMHPRNVPCLNAAAIDCCVLANNHVVDWGRGGLVETLASLWAVGLATAGAGRSSAEAWAPALIGTPRGRVLVYGLACADSGVPRAWAATERAPGVNLLRDLSAASADHVIAQVGRHRRPGDVVVASIHWGSNWGHDVPTAHRVFAHRLIDSGMVDVIHGHSSHHPKGIEVRRGRPILYGCGDFLNDYEGISGHEEFRPDLALMYLVTLDRGSLVRLRMVPLRIERMRLHRAGEADASWLERALDRDSESLGTRVELTDDGDLEVRWR